MTPGLVKLLQQTPTAYKVAAKKKAWKKQEMCRVLSQMAKSKKILTKRIWKLSLQTKSGLGMFIWCLAHSSLAVRRNNAKRRVTNETICPMCSRMDEDCGHLIINCHGAMELLANAKFGANQENTGSVNQATKRSKKFGEWMRRHNRVWVLRSRWWSAKNKVNAREKKKAK